MLVIPLACRNQQSFCSTGVMGNVLFLSRFTQYLCFITYGSLRQRFGMQRDPFSVTLGHFNFIFINHHSSRSLDDLWGINDDRATAFLHSSLSSAFRRASPNPNLVYITIHEMKVYYFYLTWALLIFYPNNINNEAKVM